MENVLGSCCGINLLGFKAEFFTKFASKFYCASPYMVAIEFDDSYTEEEAARYLGSHYGVIPMTITPIKGCTIEDIEKDVNKALAECDFDCDFNDFIKETISIKDYIKQHPFNKQAMKYFEVKD